MNHDDGETLAVIHCNECHDLCAECDRFLHLPKKNWNHTRKVIILGGSWRVESMFRCILER